MNKVKPHKLFEDSSVERLEHLVEEIQLILPIVPMMELIFDIMAHHCDHECRLGHLAFWGSSEDRVLCEAQVGAPSALI